MNRRKIAEKAIRKAQDNDWSFRRLLPDKIYTKISYLRWKTDGWRLELTYREEVFNKLGKNDLGKSNWLHIHDKRMFNTEHILLDREFNRYLWGNEEVNPYGEGMTALKFKFTQMAVEIGDKLYSVDRSPLKIHQFQNQQDRLNKQATVDPIETVVIERKLEDMWYQVPIQTHQLDSIDLAGTEPAWKYHLKQMVASHDPFAYLEENL